MKKIAIVILSLTILIIANVYSQTATSISFKLRYKVYVRGNPSFPIMYSPGKIDTEKVVQKIYDVNGNLIGTVKGVSKVWAPAFKFDFTRFRALKNIQYLYADLVQSDDKTQLYIYFCPFNSTSTQASTTAAATSPGYSANYAAFDQLIKDGNFYIDLHSRQNLSFKTAAVQVGPMTLPFKVYLGSRDGSHFNDVTTSVNLSGYYGWRWGRTGFVNLPEEKTGKMHQTFFSFNFIGGMTKVDVDSTTNIDKSIKKGSALAISPGAGIGFHYDNFAIFAMIGTDLPLGDVASDWRFKNQPWIGFGVGFSIL